MIPNIESVSDKISFLNIEEKPITHYEINDGRFWSIEDAAFTDSLPEGAVVGLCGNSMEESTIENLISGLDSYGFDKGELKTDAEYAVEVRAKRDQLLAETDFMMMPDYPLSEAKRAAVAAYRQALRDVPAQYGFPRQIDWPLKTF